MDAGSFEAPATGEQKRELIERLFDELNLPLHERARHYAGVARILEERRPASYISNISTATSDSASKRSTQASFASSRTSYASTASGDVLSNFPLPPVAEETTPQQALTVISSPARRESSHLHRKLQKSTKFGRSSSVSDRSTPRPTETSDATGTSNGLTPRTRWCPWCQIYVSRPNDFKKHVLQYCCGLFTFVCRNPACRNLCGQERQARDHRRDGEDVHCRTGFFKVEMQCRREHFGCGYCSSYFDDLEKFIEHFGESCRPDRVQQHRYQKSRQIRALLQQPPLLPLVEAMCLQYRGRVDAYRALWWTWKSRRMDCIIRKLEYGPKPKVDDKNPGIAYDRVEEFVKFLIKPSLGSVWAVDVVLEAVAEEKELPPLPMQDQTLYTDDTIMSSNNNSFDAQLSSQHMSTDDVRSSIAMSAQMASNPSFSDPGINTWYPYNSQSTIGHDSTATFGRACTSAVPGVTHNNVMDGQWVSYPTMDQASFQQASEHAPQHVPQVPQPVPQHVPQHMSQHEQQPSETDIDMHTTSWIDSGMYGVG